MKKVHVFCLISFLLLTVIFCIGCSGTMEPSPEEKNSGSSKKDENPAIEFDNDYWYTVYFDDSFNSYSSGDKDPNPQYLYVRKPATTVQQLPEPPVHKGYEFAGWYTEPNGNGTEFTADTQVTGNITVYAKWIRYYYVTIYSPHGSFERIEQKVLEGEFVEEPETPVEYGWRFEGWYNDGELFDFSKPITSDIYLYAVWTDISCSVTFTYKYTVGRDDIRYDSVCITIQNGDCVTEPEEPVLDGYIFKGWYWYSNPESSGPYVPFDFSTPITHSIYIYTEWIPAKNTVSSIMDYYDLSIIKMSVEQNGSIVSLIADTSFDSYVWKINGVVQSENSNVLLFDKSTLKNGEMTGVLLMVKKGSNFGSIMIYVTMNKVYYEDGWSGVLKEIE